MKHLMSYALAALVGLALVSCDKDDTQKSTSVQEQQTEQQSEQPTDPQEAEEQYDDTDKIYQFSVLTGLGDTVSLSDYRGQVILVLNSATTCGFTPQYRDLQQWYEQYADQGFIILDFPCNQFGNQAEGTYEEIHDFVTEAYNITFPQFAKIDVNGITAHPLYVWLKSKKPGNIPWNFTKFIVNRDGEVVARFDAQTSTMNQVLQAIKAEL